MFELLRFRQTLRQRAPGMSNRHRATLQKGTASREDLQKMRQIGSAVMLSWEASDEYQHPEATPKRVAFVRQAHNIRCLCGFGRSPRRFSGTVCARLPLASRTPSL